MGERPDQNKESLGQATGGVLPNAALSAQREPRGRTRPDGPFTVPRLMGGRGTDAHDPAGLRAVGLASLRAERLVFAGIEIQVDAGGALVLSGPNGSGQVHPDEGARRLETPRPRHCALGWRADRGRPRGARAENRRT